MSFPIPYMPAKFQGRHRGLPTVVVIHSMEAPEKGATAENVARYFQTIDRTASVHYNVDSDSVVQSVPDTIEAYGAGGANTFGLHFEHAGYARQTRAEWTDEYGQRMLLISAALVARKCSEHGIAVRFLSAGDLARGERSGITTHAEVTKAFRKSTHTDPGPGFPMDDYLNLVRAIQGQPAVAHVPAPLGNDPGATLRKVAEGIKLAKTRVLTLGASGPAVKFLQAGINQISGRGLAVDGEFGPSTDRAVRDLQRFFHLPVDGVVGPKTWALLYR